MIRIAVLFLSIAFALPLSAQTPAIPAPANLYAQYLVDTTARRHPELLQLDLHATAPSSAESVIIASKDAARVGHKSDRDDVEVFKTGTPRVEINRTGDQNVEAEVALFDVNRRTIGTVEMTFPYVAGMDEDALIKKADGIRDELSRRILDIASLLDPTRLDARIPIRTYAQFLVDDTLERHPEVEVMALHAKGPQGIPDYPIIASNIGRIGKAADPSDLDVINSGTPHTAVDTQGARVESKVVLQDATGNAIGVLAVIFPYRKIQNPDALQRQAEKIRDELRPRIANVASLYRPYPAVNVAEAAKPIEEYNKQELGNKQELPMTKEVVSGQSLKDSGQDGYTEAIKNVAGVAPATSKSSPNDSILIRGINLNLFSNYRLNGGLATAGVITTPTEDKERVETLKGANALMFGVASPAGIINMVTKRATDHDIFNVTLSGNAFGQYGASADMGQRFGPEKQVGVRVNLSAAHLENGVKGAPGHGEFGSIGADWKVNDRLSFQGDFEDYGKHVVQQGGVSLLPAVNGVVPITPVPNPRNLLSGPWTLYSARTTNIQGRADYILAEGWKLIAEAGRSDSSRTRFITRIGKYDRVTGAGGTVTINDQDQSYVNKFARTELIGQFVTGPFSHNLTLGLSHSERNTEPSTQNQFTLPQKQNIFDPISLPEPVIPPCVPTPTKVCALGLQASKDTALYTYDTIAIGRQWKVLAGFRESKSEEESDQATSTTKSSTYVGSPAGGVLFDILPTITLFASYMKGLEDGPVAPVIAVNANVVLPPGVSTQKEIGIRDTYFKGLSLSASYFDITRLNGVTNAVTNIFAYDGVMRFKGAEAVAAFEINRQWTVNSAIQWLNAVQVPIFDLTISGKVPENTPKWLGNASVTHRPALLPGLTLTAGVSFAAARPVNPQDQGFIPGYALYTAGANYVTKIGGHRTAFGLSVDNIANKRYWNSVQTGTYGTGMDRGLKMNAQIEF